MNLSNFPPLLAKPLPSQLKAAAASSPPLSFHSCPFPKPILHTASGMAFSKCRYYHGVSCVTLCCFCYKAHTPEHDPEICDLSLLMPQRLQAPTFHEILPGPQAIGLSPPGLGSSHSLCLGDSCLSTWLNPSHLLGVATATSIGSTCPKS